MHKFCCIVPPKTTSLLPASPARAPRFQEAAVSIATTRKPEESQESLIVGAIFLMAVAHIQKGGDEKPGQGNDFHRNYFSWCIIIQGFALSGRTSAQGREEARAEEATDPVSTCYFNRARRLWCAVILS